MEMSTDIKKNNLSTKSRYRPEIDGLRAFAVVAVIINHFNKEILPNGYLGVDIFFVISGFVITSSLYQRPSKNLKDFISGFYERRIRRLVPALSVFVLITSIVICLFNPFPGISLLTGITSLFGISNIYLFQQSTDYFAQPTQLNVFTHTWSLGVEEQFYILFPLLTWFSGFGRKTKNGGRNLFLAVGALAITSLIGFLYLYPTNQSAAYLLMPSRFWEIASGCLLFIGLQKKKSTEQILKKIPPLLLLTLIIGVMYLPMSLATTSTVAVVVLSLVLIASLKEGTPSYTFFTNSKVVYIGLISYSLYLWHWGVLSISRWTIGIHWWSIPFQIALIFGLAIASYQKLEKPLRKGYWFGNRWKTLLVGGGVLITLSGGLVALGKPLKGKLYSGAELNLNFTKKLREYKGGVTGRLAKNCTSSDHKKYDALRGANKITNQFIDNCLSAKNKKPLIAFSGDSHSLSIFPISEVIASTSKFEVFSHSRAGCAFPSQGKTTRRNCHKVQSSVANVMIKEMSNRNYESFVVATSYLNSHFGYTGAHRNQFIRHNDGSRSSVDKNLMGFINASKKLGAKLEKINASLILVAPLPQHPNFTPAICSKQWFRPLPEVSCQKTKRDFLEEQRKHIVEALNKLASEVNNIYIFDTFNKFCDINYCYITRNNTNLFIDKNHLSEEGAIMISNDLISLINQINSEKK